MGGRFFSRSSMSCSASGWAAASASVSAVGPSSGEQVGWVGAVGKSGVEGVEPVAAEHPIVAFGGDAAGEVGVGGDDGLGTDAGKLVCLLIGQRCA